MRHRFKSLNGAARRIRRLEKLLMWYEERAQKTDNQLNILAKLGSDTPAFFNPFEVMAAQNLRDDILTKHG